MVALIVAWLAGVYFGLSYRCLVLVPLTLAAMLTSSAIWAWQDHPSSSALLAIVIPAIGLQGGYMIGLTGRDHLGQLISRLRAITPSRGL